MSSLHLVKWSNYTKMVVFLFTIVVKGPTKSTDSTCQGLLASRYFLCSLLVIAPCFADWHTSYVRISLSTSPLIPGQHQSIWTLLRVQIRGAFGMPSRMPWTSEYIFRAPTPHHNLCSRGELQLRRASGWSMERSLLSSGVKYC